MLKIEIKEKKLNSWDRDNFIKKNRLKKKITELNYQTTQYWMMKLKKKTKKMIEIMEGEIEKKTFN
jgi:hypothetical protein